MTITADDARVMITSIAQTQGDRYTRRLEVVREEVGAEIEDAIKLGMIRCEIYVFNCMNEDQLTEDEFIARTIVKELQSNGFKAESFQYFDGLFYNHYIMVDWA